jgi:hypothetical protein
MLSDIHAARARILSGQTNAPAELDQTIAAAQSPACSHALSKPRFDEARQAAAMPPPARSGRWPGWPSRSRTFSTLQGKSRQPAQPCWPMPRPRGIAPRWPGCGPQGAAIIGRTNMTEFAFSGVGVNPHHGTPANACDSATVARVPGGSSSGAAVSVATGAAFVGLGSDTGGSIRIPAALNGIVGFKNTARLVPTAGAAAVHHAGHRVRHDAQRARRHHGARDAGRAHRHAQPGAAVFLPAGRRHHGSCWTVWTPPVAAAFERTLKTLRDAGAHIDPRLPLPPMQDLGTIQSTGGFSAAESYAWHRELLTRRGNRYDPRVRARIERGAAMKAWEYLDLVQARHDWMARVGLALAGYDAVLSPTVPIIAPPLADVAPGAGTRRGVLPRQRPAAAQPQRRQHAGRMRHFHPLPATRRVARGPDDLARRAARRHRAEHRLAGRSSPGPQERRMRIAIVGAGIIGVTTAYELAADGHEVTVFERRSAAAEETSFANAGVVAPGYVTPWAAPGMPTKVARYLFSQHAPVKLALPLAGADLAWMWKWLRACRLETYLANRARMQRLAFYSRERLHHLTDELQLDYDRSPGYMVLLRSEADSKLIQPGLQVLRDAGVSFSEISSAQARLIEPALNPDTQFLGAVHLPADEVGNCRQFALLLKKEAEALGARFEFNANVAALDPSHPATLAVQGEPAPRHFEPVQPAPTP